MRRRKLYKTNDGAMIAGVCAGIAEYLGVDVTLIRLAAILLTFMGGSGLLVYLIAAIIMPDKGSVDNRWRPTGDERHYYDATTIDKEENARHRAGEAKRSFSGQEPASSGGGLVLAAYILIGAGVYLLLSRYVNWRHLLYTVRPFYPAILIGLGLLFLLNSRKN